MQQKQQHKPYTTNENTYKLYRVHTKRPHEYERNMNMKMNISLRFI